MLNSIFLKSAIPNWVLGTILFVALIGFADAAYLTVVHFQGGTPPCSVLQGCEIVTTSKYSTIGPIPIALLGSVFYLSVLVSVIAYWDSKKRFFAGLLPILGIVGFMVSVFLVFLQLFVIKAICLYCIASATSSTLIFLLAVSLLQFRSPAQ